MSKEELAERLDHLDPGATFPVDAGELAHAFGAERLNSEVVQQIEAFAMDHRSTFTYDEHGQTTPCFGKDDVF